MIRDEEFSVSRVTRFYVPMLVQAFSQSLTYPLLAGIVGRSANAADMLAIHVAPLAMLATLRIGLRKQFL